MQRMRSIEHGCKNRVVFKGGDKTVNVVRSNAMDDMVACINVTRYALLSAFDSAKCLQTNDLS